MIGAGDDGNIVLATSKQFVDSLNAKFYSKFTYPWPPMMVDKYTDPHFEVTMLNQSIGDWKSEVNPLCPAVWVAGCGTNQAAITALRFSAGRVLGSDLSARSLEACAHLAEQVGVTNLDLKLESIIDVDYAAQFDFVVCTGVIHHNADPEAALRRLAAALKPDGVMELMVYNRYHRLVVSGVQRAVRILKDAGDEPDFALELDIARKLAAEELIHVPGGRSSDYLKRNESHLADALIQPVEYGYTVESLAAMADRCGLEILVPCINQFDLARGTYNWNIDFQDPELRSRYEALADTRRWQVTNLLRLEDSPMLWFYLQHKDSARPRRSEPELFDSFLDCTFQAAHTEREIHVKRGDVYQRAPARQPFPGSHPDLLCRRVVECMTSGERRPMRNILEGLGVELSFSVVNRLRMHLTTTGFPYLRAVRTTA